MVKVLTDETIPAGKVTVPFLLHDMARGSYTVAVSMDGIPHSALPLMVP